MSTTGSTLKEEIKKSKESKQKEKFKFIAAILITNLMVALLCFPFGENEPSEKSSLKVAHANHSIMVMPITAMISDLNQKEIPVSLISKEKKVIVKKAYLHDLIKTVDSISHFKIEIKNEDVVKLSEFVEVGVVAVPYVESIQPKKISRRGSKYEVSI